MTATLYQLKWSGEPVAVPGFSWSKDELKQAGAISLLDGDQWAEYPGYSCQISIAPLAVQLGSLLRVSYQENGSDGKPQNKTKDFDLRDLNLTNASNPSRLTDLKTHRGGFYNDGTFMVCTNKGLHMGYWDHFKKEFEAKWLHDPAIETEVVQKISLINGGLYKALQNQLPALVRRAAG